jgi:hypothetical protein
LKRWLAVPKRSEGGDAAFQSPVSSFTSQVLLVGFSISAFYVFVLG